MILAIDVGNTNIVLGCFDSQSIRFTARLSTDRFKTGDEYAVLIANLLSLYKADPAEIEGAILSSVVPPLKRAISEAIRIVTGQSCMVVGSGIKTGLNIQIDNPAQLGSDRVVDAVAALAEYKPPIMIFDLGTATTFNVVDEDKVFRGGVICPGLSTGLRALGERCAQLPQVHLSSPKSAIGVDTEKCMLSGSVLGAAVLLDGITQRIEEELGRPVTLVVTGGLAKYVIPLCRHPLTYDPELLLKGLALLYQLNAPQHEHRHEPRNEGEHRRPGPRPAGRRPHSGSSPRRHSRSGRRPRRDDEAKAG